MQLTIIQSIAMWALPVLFAITVHEVAHGYVAYLLGDKTAKILGRLTFNPIKHIDLLGTIIIPLTLLLCNTGMLLGWAKPVPIDVRNFKHPRRDSALVSAAGPLSNLVLAMVWAGVAKGGMILLGSNFPGALAIYMMGMAGISINVMLLVVNLLPIPSLDGGHILASLLPPRLAFYYERIPYNIVFLVLLILLALGVMDFVLQPVIHFLMTLIITTFGLSLPY